MDQAAQDTAMCRRGRITENSQKPEGSGLHNPNFNPTKINTTVTDSGQRITPTTTKSVPEQPEQLTDLPVGHADQPFVHQLVCFGISGLPLHNVTLSLLVCQGDSRDL